MSPAPAKMASRVRALLLPLDAWSGTDLAGKPATIVNDLAKLESISDPDVVLRSLESVDWSFQNDRTDDFSHDIHPYASKFIPQIPRFLVRKLSLPGERVWDPFGGSGTTALEALLLGRRAISTDANPLSAIIGLAKTITLAKEEEDSILDFLEEISILLAREENVQEALDRSIIERSKYIPDAPNLREWFDPQAINELSYLRWRIDSLDSERRRVLPRVAFSAIIVKSSFQDGETRYARRPRRVPVGSVLRYFYGELKGDLEKARELAPLLRFREADFRTLDMRMLFPGGSSGGGEKECVSPGSIDLIVTSPPYPNANDYHLYHRFRLFWLGSDPREFGRHEIGSHLRYQKERKGFRDYLQEMEPCLSAMHQALRPGRYAAIVLGDSVFDGKVLPTARLISKLAETLGFEAVGSIPRQIHATRRSFIPSARRALAEEILILRKPPSTLKMVLDPPNYRCWPYEEVLRWREIHELTRLDPAESEGGRLRIGIGPYRVDRLRRLTFTSGFQADGYWRESTWQSVLENGDGESLRSRRKEPKYVTHGLHPYKGKFYPQLARCLFNLAGLSQGQQVLDPFCGSGTVLLEGYLNGLSSIGFDLNPLAIKVANVKTRILEVDPYLLDRQLAKFQDRLKHLGSNQGLLSRFTPAVQRELESWFPARVLGKLGWLIQEIELVPDPRVRELLEVVTSSIIREVSQQEPRDLRIRRRSVPIEDAPVKELMERLIAGHRTKLQRFFKHLDRAPSPFLHATAIVGDCRQTETYQRGSVNPGSIDAVVTSPPYATALPYIDTDRLSLLLLFGLRSRERALLEERLIGSREIDRNDRERFEHLIDASKFDVILSGTARQIILEVKGRNERGQVGFRRQNMAALLYRYFSDVQSAMENLNRVMRPGSSAFFVIGDNWTLAGGKQVRIANGQAFRELGESIGWGLKESIPITVTTEDQLHSKHSITRNEILWFQRS